METRAAAFLTLPGGIGTLEEMAEIVALRSLDVLEKPLVVLNHLGYYDDLLRFFSRMTRERFIPVPHDKLFAVARTLDEVWEKFGVEGEAIEG
jgi:uncharacterized protein (TIGR00730 family)